MHLKINSGLFLFLEVDLEKTYKGGKTPKKDYVIFEQSLSYRGLKVYR